MKSIVIMIIRMSIVDMNMKKRVKKKKKKGEKKKEKEKKREIIHIMNTMMKKRIKAEINKVPEFNALPQGETNEAGREKVRNIIKAHKQRHKERKEGKGPAFGVEDVRPDVINYARERFPAISDANIVRNRDIFSWMKRMGQQVDGYHCRLVMSKFTGLVNPFMQYPLKKAD